MFKGVRKRHRFIEDLPCADLETMTRRIERGDHEFLKNPAKAASERSFVVTHRMLHKLRRYLRPDMHLMTQRCRACARSRD